MKIKKIFSIPVLAGLLAMVMLAGCGNKKDSTAISAAASNMYEHVSTSSILIAKVNGQTLLDNAGIKVNGDKLTLPHAIKREFHNPEAERQLAKLAGTLDLNSILVVMKSENDYFYTAPTADSNRLRKMLSDFADEEVYEGFHIYHVDYNVFAIVRDNQVWLTNSPGIVFDDYEEASINSIADSKKLCEKLRAGTVSAIFDVKEFERVNGYVYDMGLDIPGDFVGMTVDLSGAKLTGSLDIYDSKFNNVSLDISSMIDGKISAGDFASLPSDADIVLAVAKPNKDFISTVLSLVEIDDFQRILAEEVLSGINGSIAVGVKIPSKARNLMDPLAWEITAAVNFDEDKANNILSFLPMVADAREYGDGYVINVDVDRYRSMPVYIGYKNGQVVASTSPLTESRGYAGAQALNATAMGLIFNIPAGTVLKEIAGVNFGVAGDLIISDDGLDGSVELTNTNKTLLTTLLEQAFGY